MCLAIIHLLQEYKPDIIVIEKLAVTRNMVSVRCLCKVIGAVYCYSILHKNVFYYEIQPSEWRSKLGFQSQGKRREEFKQLSMQYVKENYNITVNDDESDAICAGLGYIALFDNVNQ